MYDDDEDEYVKIFKNVWSSKMQKKMSLYYNINFGYIKQFC